MALGFGPRDYLPSLVNQQTYDVNQLTTEVPNGGLPRPQVSFEFGNLPPTVGRASTANAVTAVSAQPDPQSVTSRGYQAQVRAAEQGLYNPAMKPYTTRDVGGGITRLDVRGESPLFTNMDPSAARDDLARKGPMLASAREFLKGVPEFGQGYRGPIGEQAAASSPAMQLDPQIANLLMSRSIVDNWRGRMLQRAMIRQGQLGVAQTGARVAQQNANTNARGVDTEFALGTMRDATTRRGQEFSLLPHLPQFQRDTMVNRSIAKGDYDTARNVATISAPRVGNAPKGYEAVTDMLGNVSGAFNKDTGTYNAFPQLNPDDLKKVEILRQVFGTR